MLLSQNGRSRKLDLTSSNPTSTYALLMGVLSEMVMILACSSATDVDEQQVSQWTVDTKVCGSGKSRQDSTVHPARIIVSKKMESTLCVTTWDMLTN